MTIEERIAKNPGSIYTKMDKQWRGYDIYKVTDREDPRPPGYDAPMFDAWFYVAVDKDGNARALNDDELWVLESELYPENLGLPPKQD